MNHHNSTVHGTYTLNLNIDLGPGYIASLYTHLLHLIYGRLDMKRSSVFVKPDESSIVLFVDMKDTVGAKRPKETHHWKTTAKVQRCGYPSVKTR